MIFGRPFLASYWIAAMLICGCGASVGVDGALADPDGCELVEQPPDTGSLWPELVEGPTACPRAVGEEESGAVLEVGRASVGQSHCSDILLGFGLDVGACGWDDVVEIHYVAHGPGVYTVGAGAPTCFRDPDGVPLGISPEQDPYGASAWLPDGQPGTGTLSIESNTGLDNQWTRGWVDVVFPNGTRLLADFLAPLCSTE